MDLAQDLLLACDPAAFAARYWFEPNAITGKLERVNLDEWQTKFLRSEARRIALCVSRQAGKSACIAAKVLQHVIYEPGALVLMTAASARQSQEGFLKVRRLMDDARMSFQFLDEPFGDEFPELAEDRKLSLVLPNASRVVALPCRGSSTRGYSRVTKLVIDEAAYVPDAFFTAISPALAVGNGQLIIASTPAMKRGRYWEAVTKPDSGYELYKVDALHCPRLSPEFLAQERKDMGEQSFMAEYMLQFNDLAGSVFDLDDVQALVSDDVLPLDLGAPITEPVPLPVRPLLQTDVDLWGD